MTSIPRKKSIPYAIKTISTICFFLTLRYFVEVTLAALCVEWTVVLGVLLLDVSVLARTVETVRKQGGVEGGVFARIVQGVEEIHSWAESDWYVCFCSQGSSVFIGSLVFLPLKPKKIATPK